MITDKIANILHIGHSDELMALYWSHGDFSDSLILNTAFNLYILWLNLSKRSELHKNKLKEINKRCEKEGFTMEAKTVKDTIQKKLNQFLRVTAGTVGGKKIIGPNVESSKSASKTFSQYFFSISEPKLGKIQVRIIKSLRKPTRLTLLPLS